MAQIERDNAMSIKVAGWTNNEIMVLKAALNCYVSYATDCAAFAHSRDLLDLESMWAARVKVAEAMNEEINLPLENK